MLPSALAGDEIHWKPLEQGQVKLEGRVPKNWNVLQAEKKKNLILVQVGRRYIAFDLKLRAAYEIATRDLEARGKDFLSDEPAKIGRTIPLAEWNTRDVGPATLLHVKLQDYGRILEVFLPHPLDLRAVY